MPTPPMRQRPRPPSAAHRATRAVTLYWLTNTGASSSRFYWENNNNNFSSAAQKTTDIKVPVAISVLPHEIYRAPRSWSERASPTLYYYHQVAKGGHFAAWEEPQLFAEELRAAFRPVRRQLGHAA
jgi:pimeloyl-ACP methyl ester carboxylesterase